MIRSLVVQTLVAVAVLAASEQAPCDVTKTKNVTGVVRLPDGSPAASADVVMTQDENSPASPNSPLERRSKDSSSTKTKADGTFNVELAHPGGLFAIGVAHEGGYFEATESTWPAGNADVTLKPWGRIEGVIARAGKPLPNAQLRVEHFNMNRRPHVSFNHVVQSNAEGRFVVKRALPDFVSLVHLENGEETGGRYVEVEAGKTTQANYGGAGRAVSGRINLQALGDVLFDKTLFQANGVSTKLPAMPSFWSLVDTPEAGLRDYEEHAAWRRTDEGKAYYRAYAGVAFKLKPDGSFLIHDVGPGEYDLHVYMDREPGKSPSDPLVELDRVVTIPDGPAGEPFDLGVLEPDKVDRPGM